MSNVGRINGGSPPPPTGFVETLTGNTGGAVPPTAGNINVVGDGSTIDIVGDPGTSTLTVSLTSTARYTAETVGETEAPFTTFPIPNNNALAVFVQCVAAFTDFSNSLSIYGTTNGQTALGSTFVTLPGFVIGGAGFDSGTIRFAVQGNSMVVAAVGVAGATIRWTAYITTIYQT